MEISVSRRSLKKVLATALAIMIAVSSLWTGLAVVSFAEGDSIIVENGKCGDDVQYEIYDDGTAVIAGVGATWDYDEMMMEPSPFYDSKIKRVVINDGVTTIGSEMFLVCRDLVDVTIPSSISEIRFWAFDGCNNMENVYYDGTVEEWGKIDGCKTITDVKIYCTDGTFIFTEEPGGSSPDDNMGNVTDGNVTDGDISGGGYIEPQKKVFASGELDLALGWEVYQMVGDEMVSDEIILSIKGVGEIPDYADVFERPWHEYADVIELVILEGSFDRVSDYAFADMPLLNNVGNFLEEEIKEIGDYAFRNCTSLGRFYMHKGGLNIGEGAFEGCTSLYEFVVPTNLESIGRNAFLHCDSLDVIYVYDLEGNKGGADFEFAPTLDPKDYNECFHRSTEKFDREEPECTSTGLTYGEYCSDCETWIVEREEIPELGHTEVVDKAVEATCTSTGLTEGKHCSECDEIIVEQTVVPMKVHSWSDWTVIAEATLADDGEKVRRCYICSETETEVILQIEGEVTTDVNTGVSVEYTGDAYNDKEMTVQVVEDALASNYLVESYEKMIAWDIKTIVDGVEAQPDAPVLVTLTIPDGFDESSIAIYHVNSLTGEIKEVEIVDVQNGKVKFFAESFSTYILVDKSTEVEEENIFTSFKKFICLISEILNFLFKFLAMLK